jgi:hypothetical protein
MRSFWNTTFPGVLVGHSQPELVAAAAYQVFEKIVEPLHQVPPAGRYRLPHHFRVGQHEIARRQGVDVLPRVELHLLRRLLVEPFDLSHRLV